MRWVAVLGCAALLASGCGDSDSVEGYEALGRHVERHRVGAEEDYWIEMQTVFGEWERTGLIFGYLDDYGECKKAIAGLTTANPHRTYRCSPANQRGRG